MLRRDNVENCYIELSYCGEAFNPFDYEDGLPMKIVRTMLEEVTTAALKTNYLCG